MNKIEATFDKFFNYKENFFRAGLIDCLWVAISNSKDEFMFDTMLKECELGFDSPLLLREIDDYRAMSNDNTDNFFARKSPKELKEHPVIWPYYAFYLCIKNIYNNPESAKESLPGFLTILPVKAHEIIFNYKKIAGFSEEYIIRVATLYSRCIEFLLYSFADKESVAYKEVFQNKKTDCVLSFLSFLKKKQDEPRESFYIMKDEKAGIYLRYHNEKTDLNVAFFSSRRVNLGSEDNLTQNHNIYDYLLDDFDILQKVLDGKVPNRQIVGKRKSKKHNQHYAYEEPIEACLNTHVSEDEKKFFIQGEWACEQKLQLHKKSRRLTKKVSSQIPNSFKQHLQNKEFSATLLKGRLLLSVDRKIPHDLQLKNFIKHLYSVKNEKKELFFCFFLLDLFCGQHFDAAFDLLKKERNKAAQINLEKGFMQIYAQDKIFSAEIKIGALDKSRRKIKYEIPSYLLWHMTQAKEYLNENEIDESQLKKRYILWFKKAIKSYDKRIEFGIDRLWKILTSYRRKIGAEDLSILFCITKYHQNDTARLAYYSTYEQDQVFVPFIQEMSKRLGIYDILNVSEKEQITPFAKEKIYVGSSRKLSTNAGIDFFQDIYKLYQTNHTLTDKFNLYAIYTRFALSLLLGTRDFHNSCNLKRVSKRFRILSIDEKGQTAKTGIRVIPLCATAFGIIEKYQNLCVQLGVEKDNIYMFIDGQKVLFHKTHAQDFLESLGVDEAIKQFVKKVPLNTGRHVITRIAVETGFSGNYLDALLGHYSQGEEPSGRFSMLNNEKYKAEVKNLLEKVAKIYRIKI